LPVTNALALLLTLQLAASGGKPLPPLQCVDGHGKVAVPARAIHRVGGEVTQPVVAERVAADLDPQRRVYGFVIVEAVISREGRVCATRVLKGDEEVARAVVAALVQWRFEPATLHGKPVAVYYTLTANFHPR
jgi:TonB family protein